MNKNNNESEPQKLISLNIYSRIVAIIACGIIFLENIYIIGSLPYGFLLIFIVPIDTIAFLLLGLVLILEFFLNRSKKCNKFLLTGIYFLIWSILTISWRFLLPDWALEGSEPGGDLQFSLLIFLIASIWFAIALWELINLLHEQTAEGRAIYLLHPNLRKQFYSIAKLYIQFHVIFSIISVVGLGIGNVNIQSLGILGKIVIVPLLGIITFGSIPVLYMTHRMADVKRVPQSKKYFRDYSKNEM